MIKVIYHMHCTDGFGAAFAAWLKFGHEAEYIPADYTYRPPVEDFRRDEVYVLDFSYPHDETQALIANSEKFVWLDHHKTAFENWCGEAKEFHEEEGSNVLIRLDNNKSGALLAWEYFHGDAPQIIRHIDDRDRWQFKIDGTREMHAYLASIQPWSFEQWNKMLERQDYDQWYAAGRAILNAQSQLVVRQLAQTQKVNLFGREGLAVNASAHLSEVGHELANKSGTFGLVWYVNKRGGASCSLRSNGDYDVSEIAREFAGGGHKNAAGFETALSILLPMLGAQDG